MAQQNFMPDFMKGKDGKDTAATPPTEKPKVEETKGNAEGSAPAKKKPRKTKAKEMTPEHIQFVLGNVKNMSYTDMAEKTGLTKHQVNRILMDTKKNLRENTAEGSPERAKVEEYIKNELSRPEDSRPGAGGGRGSKVKEGLDSAASDIMKQLGLG